MNNLSQAFKEYLWQKEKHLFVNKNMKTELRHKIFPRPPLFSFLRIFVGGAGALILVMVFFFSYHPNQMVQTVNSISSSQLRIDPYQIENFICRGDCRRLIVIGEGRQLFIDHDLKPCSEVRLWANLNGDGDKIELAGYAANNKSIVNTQINLPTQEISLKDYPDWFGQKFPVNIPELEAELEVTLEQAGEWNLISNISCLSGCENLRAGTSEDDGLFVNTCSVDNIYKVVEIGHGSFSSSGEYEVVAWRRPSILATDNSPGEPAVLATLSRDEVTSGVTIFKEVDFGEAKFSFDLVSIDPEINKHFFDPLLDKEIEL